MSLSAARISDTAHSGNIKVWFKSRIYRANWGEDKCIYCCWSKRMSPAENCMSDKRLWSILRHVWQSEERVKGRRSLSEVWVRSPLKGLQQAAAGSGILGSGIEDSGKPKERIQKLKLQRKRRWAALKEKGRCEEESSKRLAESHRWCLVYLNSTKTSQVSI